jgi:hypothetical protein
MFMDIRPEPAGPVFVARLFKETNQKRCELTGIDLAALGYDA